MLGRAATGGRGIAEMTSRAGLQPDAGPAQGCDPAKADWKDGWRQSRDDGGRVWSHRVESLPCSPQPQP